MKEQIVDKLVDIIGGETIPDGIPSVLELVRKLVYEAAFYGSQHDDFIDDTTMWQSIRKSVSELVPDLLSKHDIHKHFEKKTLYSTKTSLCSTSTATLLREWLVRELHTESTDILESPRETYSIVFIDDLHLITPGAYSDEQGNEGTETLRYLDDKVENLIKGLVCQSSAFRVVTDIHVPLDTNPSKSIRPVRRSDDNGIVDHRKMPTSTCAVPLLHKSFVTDPAKALQDHQVSTTSAVSVVFLKF